MGVGKRGGFKMTLTYETRPVRKQAFQITKKIHDELMSLGEGHDICGCESYKTWPKWLQDASDKCVSEKGYFGTEYKISVDHGELVVFINTLEGRHIVSPGDFIIQGLKGELYPCKPNIFHKTYKEVE